MSTESTGVRQAVYREVGKTVETCSHGCEHEVTYVEVKYLRPTGATRLHDNGYQKRPTDLLRDAQGRVYHQRIEVDLYANTSYLRDSDGHRYTPRLPRGLVRDLAGRPLTAATPPGLPWSAALPQPRRRR